MPTEIDITRASSPQRTDPAERRTDHSRTNANFVEELLRIPAATTQFASGDFLGQASDTSASNTEDDSEDESVDRDSNPNASTNLGLPSPVLQLNYNEAQSAVKRKPNRASPSSEESVQRSASEHHENSKRDATSSLAKPETKASPASSERSAPAADQNAQIVATVDHDASSEKSLAGADASKSGITSIDASLTINSDDAKNRRKKEATTETLSAEDSVSAVKDTAISSDGSGTQQTGSAAEAANDARDASRNRRRSDRTSSRMRGDPSKESDSRSDGTSSVRDSDVRMAAKLASFERVASSSDSGTQHSGTAQPMNASDGKSNSSIATPQVVAQSSLASAVPSPSASSGPVGARAANTNSTASETSTSVRTAATTSPTSSSAINSPTTRSEPMSGGSPSTALSRYQESKLVQRVLKGMEQLSNGSEQVRMRLHPPELGTLQLTLRIDGNQVSAQMNVENAGARDALLKNLQVLKDRLSEQGMQVDRFDVQVDPQANASGFEQDLADKNPDARSRQDQATSRYAVQNNNRLDASPSAKSEDLSKMWTRTNGVLDVKV